MFDDIIRDNLSPEPGKESKIDQKKMELEQYTKIVMTVLFGLKNECQRLEYCTTKCGFYNKNDGSCYLKACPCDYELSEIEKAVSNLIDIEMNKNE